MNIIGIVCSPRKGGNTEILINEALCGAKKEGAETELVTLHDKIITPCDACRSCSSTGRCHVDDDMNEIYEKMINADGIIFGTPVYMWQMTGQAKVLMDRTTSISKSFVNKVGGIISVATRQGNSDTINTFLHYFVSRNMFIAGYVDALGAEKGGIRKDERGMKGAFELGRKMALMLKQDLSFPEEFASPFSSLVIEKYGIKNMLPIG